MIIYQNKKGLLCLKLTLSDFVLDVLFKEAIANNCSIQSEITKRLRATFYNDIEYRVRLIELYTARIVSMGTKKHTLAVSGEMMDLLVASAVVDQRSLDEEVLSRLLISLINPAEMGLVNHCNPLIHQHVINEKMDQERIAMMAMSVRYSNTVQNKGDGHV